MKAPRSLQTLADRRSEMAYVTNQWLKGIAQRNRSYHPIRVEISARPSADKWSTAHKVVADLTMRRVDKDYQSLLLTLDDLDIALPIVSMLAEKNMRIRVAVEALNTLKDNELIAV